LIDAKDGARVANNPLFLRDVLADLCAGEVRTIILHRSTAVESAIGGILLQKSFCIVDQKISGP